MGVGEILTADYVFIVIQQLRFLETGIGRSMQVCLNLAALCCSS